MWDDKWLASAEAEDIALPDQEIVDAHQHLWDDKKPRLPDYMFPDFRADAEDGHRVTTAVYVDCGWAYRSEGPEHLRPVGETESIAAVAESETFPDIAGIVSFGDLAAATFPEVLDAHAEAGRARFRGIRQSLA